jgi:eukaryotic-like serine/threonine-protein kinase
LVERELGRGGMATVYLARDLRHDRPVALKVLHPELAQTLGPERFQREVRTVARLQHPHILTVHDSGESAGRLWFTMPYVEGESLRDRLRRVRQLPLDESLRIVTEAGRALEYAHQHGVVHRDIKPENILLTRDGDTLVADFGIARGLAGAEERLTETGLALGTPAYMSPEQAAGDRQLDARSDVYSLGAVLFEMLAGEPPFTGPTAQAIIAKRFNGEVPRVRAVRPSVPEAVEQVVQRALAPAAADRFASAAQLVQALAAVPTATAPASGPTVKPSSWPRWRTLLLAGVLSLLLGLVGFLWTRRAREAPSGPVRLAVLPFDNRGAPQDEYFADGMTDEVRGKLSALPALKVIARSSSSEYKKTPKRPEEIGQELEAQYLLTATVHWVKGSGGDRVRVIPELIEAHDASTKWQKSFDAAVTDVFAVQGQIAEQVADALELVLGATERQALAAPPTENLAAYDAYARGEQAAGSLTEFNGIALRRAQEYYERAVVLDSTFVAAWLQLTRTHAMQYQNGHDPTPPRKEEVRKAMERVAALRPDGYEAHWARALYFDVMGDPGRAFAEAAAGLKRAPENADLLRLVAGYEASAGQLEASLGHLRQARQLDPRSIGVTLSLAGRLAQLRRYDEAMEVADQALALDPTNRRSRLQAAGQRVMRGDLDGAQRVIRSAPPGTDTTALYIDVAALTYAWLLDEARQDFVLRQPLEAFNHDRTTWGGTFAEIYRLRGDTLRMRAYADSSRVYQERLVRDDPANADQSQHLATLLAMVGRYAEAVKEGERALGLALATKDQALIPYIRHRLARIYTMVGRPEQAIDQLEEAMDKGSYITPGRLRIDPDFAPLKGHPRFEPLLQWER